ncbi:MAG: hypothetical protein NZL85_04295 [Fimbriimonadales bacterium]|nr:hypothetical protein [Fimbriimonadales bacterium]
MRKVSGVIGLAILLMVGNTQTFTHQQIGQGFADLGFGILTPNGIPVWSGILTSSSDRDIFRVTSLNNFTASLLGSNRQANPIAAGPNGELMWEGAGTATSGIIDVFMESTNISASVLGSSRSAFGFQVTSTGQPVWYGAGNSTGGLLDIFMGSANLTASVLGANRDAYPASLNASDQLLWDGTGDNIAGNRDVFRTDLGASFTTNVSQSVLGSSRFAVAVKITDAGNMLWYGGGSSTSGYVDVFRNTANISLSPLGSGVRDATAFDIDGTNVLWQGRSSTTGNFFDTFVNSSNLSSGALGANRDSLPIALRGNYALWEGLGASTNYNYDVLVSQFSPSVVTRNLSTTAFGNTANNTRESNGYAVFDNGNAVWVGKHNTATAGKRNLFYYRWSANSSVNLTQQALGRNAESFVMAVNAQRQILWAARNATDTEWEVWLTTENVPTTLQGTVTIAGYVGTSNPIVLTFRLIDPYTGSVAQTTSATVNPGGSYSASVANAGLWRVRVKAPRVLARAFGAMSIVGTTTLNFSMTPGDVNDDNTIDDADLLAVLFAFGGSDANADVNGDGVVDDADLLIVLFNFDASGE